jgi:hypothetical protein
MGNIGDMGSHYPVLAAAVHRTHGNILELGMGDWSTPLLSFMCKDRLLISCDSDRGWMDQFREYEGPLHRFVHVPSEKEFFDSDPKIRMIPQWAKLKCLDEAWGVCLLDCAPGEVRPELAIRLKDKCSYIVAHDFEELDKSTPCGSNYGWAKILPHFRYVFVWKRYRPHTAVLSNFYEFAP